MYRGELARMIVAITAIQKIATEHNVETGLCTIVYNNKNAGTNLRNPRRIDVSQGNKKDYDLLATLQAVQQRATFSIKKHGLHHIRNSCQEQRNHTSTKSQTC